MSKTPKRRLDQLLVERGLAENRSRAQALVMAGLVMSDTRRLDKPGHQVDINIPLTVKGPDHPWVSRGGVKLTHGLDHFSIDTTVPPIGHRKTNVPLDHYFFKGHLGDLYNAVMFANGYDLRTILKLLWKFLFKAIAAILMRITPFSTLNMAFYNSR